MPKTLKGIRAFKGIKRFEMADKLGVSLTRLSAIENSNNNFSLKRLRQIADILGYKSWELLKMLDED
jgi:transcriptional regulator with XRE-family HTH domain